MLKIAARLFVSVLHTHSIRINDYAFSREYLCKAANLVIQAHPKNNAEN